MSMNSLKKSSQKKQEIRTTELVIDSNDVMVKEYVAGRWKSDELFAGFSYSFTIKIDGVRGFQNLPSIEYKSGIKKGKIPIEAKLNGFKNEIHVKFSRPYQKGEIYAYELHFLINPDGFIQHLGSLKIIDWPKQDLSRIIFLPNSGSIFFSSALAKITADVRSRAKIIEPGGFSHSIISHSRKSSAIRIEWGKVPPILLQFNYIIRNIGRNPAKNIKLTSYIPPNTKFQKSFIKLNRNINQNNDLDENTMVQFELENLEPKIQYTFSFNVQIIKTGNRSIILPNFGTWNEYKNLTSPNTIGESMIQPSRFWPLENPKIVELVKVLKKHSINASQYIKIAFEFVNQKISYEINGIREDAASVLASRKGDCSEMSDLFVAILRGGGIPAKIVHGWIIELGSFKLEPHAWCEFFSPRAGGWRECDPTWGYLTGVSCQHITRQREGIIKEQHAFSWIYQGETDVSVEEQISITKV
ncbi:transglutaminase-like domain-containing protein [Candidatus Harpocratesius sp.]